MLKYDFGCNTIRCSHYPQDPEFLRRCDEVGLLVLEEIPGWKFIKSSDAAWTGLLKDALRDMVVRDRNHPSIISFGVRVNESADDHALYTATNALAHTLDPTRPTHGVRIPGNGSTNEFLEDIWGQNFICSLSTPAVMPWITTETVGHRFATHSWDSTGRLVEQMLQYAAVQDSGAQNSHIAGMLGWCAFDYYSTYYIAEKRVCYHGVADLFRIPKFSAYFFKSQTNPAIYGPTLFIAHYWEKSLVPANDVWVVSNCDSVELFVNGISQGKHGPQYYKNLPHPLYKWSAVPYAAGELKAIGYIQGSAVTSFVRHTPGKAIKLVVSPDTSALFDNGDMTRVVVTAVDTFGQVVPRNGDIVTLSVSGAGKFLGESPIALEDGKTAFFVQTRENEQGTIVCQAVSSTLPTATATISVLRSDSVATGIAPVTIQKNNIASHSKTMLVTNSRFAVPGWAVHTCKVAVYTPMGRFVYEKPITSTIITLPHQTVASAQQLLIVRIVPEK